MQASGTRRAIIHIDMDCFFASVAALAHPALAGQPLAVCHSNATHGSGEISSANYLARGFGIYAGQMIGAAKQLCPHLVVMPYDFEQLEAISEQVTHSKAWQSRVQSADCSCPVARPWHRTGQDYLDTCLVA